MTDPSFRRGPPYSSSGRVGENTMEALKEFLQDMTKTIELLCNRYNTTRQTLKTAVFESPDVRTSLSIGMPSISPRVFPTREEIPGTHLRRDISGFRVPPNTLQPASNSEQLFASLRYDEGKLDQMQRWFSQNCSFEERMRGWRSNSLEERRLIAAIFETQAPTYGRSVGTNSQGHSSGAKDGDALGTFLKDMKKTIQAWSARHNLLVQGKAISARRDADDAELGETAEAVCPQRHPLDSDVRIIGQLELGVDRVSRPCNKDQDVAVIQVLDLPNQREDEACRSGQDKEEAGGECFIQIQEGKERENSLSQAEQRKADSTSLILHGEIASQSPQRDREPAPQKVHDVQEPSKAAKVGFQSSSPIILEEDPVQSKSEVVHKEMDVEITSRNDSGEVDNFVTPKADPAETKIQAPDWILETTIQAINEDSAREVKIQPYERKVDVVDSPEWLPKGWITEVKTRSSGNSAGSKDKYYFDPVSKRRFRSKKEVFCFLETGKLGRYKRRPRIKPLKELLGTELPSPGQVIDLSQAKPAKRVRKSSYKATNSKSQQNTPSTLDPSTVVSAVTPPTGLFSNLFMPYRPGQPSDWLVYESLASLPLPVFEHFRYAEYNRSKSSSRGPVTRPWFLNSPEGSWRPLVDKNNLGKSTEKSKDVQGLQFGAAEAEGLETMSKHSATEARKPTKKTSA